MPSSWLRRLFHRPTGTTRKSRTTARLDCQVLEDRTVPYNVGGRWTNTVTDGGGIQRGTPIHLTWGFIRDGVNIPGEGTSNLISRLDALYGAGPGGNDLTQRPWFFAFDQAFDRWSEVIGIDYVYEPNDDGAALPSGAGSLGVRADVRICGVPSGAGFLAFNYFPNAGDMVFDTQDFNPGAFFSNLSNNSRRLRNTITHEHGHGIGLDHEVPQAGAAVMEPSANTNFDGPQFDDILGAQRNYGDVREKNGGNDTQATATLLGALPANGSVSLGTSVGTTQFVSATAIDFLSIDGTSDTDIFSLAAAQGTRLAITVTPVGPTYLSGVQGGAAPTAFNSANQSDLILQLINSSGAVVATSNSGGLGVAEAIPSFDTPLGGNYFVRVTGATDRVQMYKLDVTSTLVSPTVTITRNTSQPAITNTGPIRFDVRFSLPVTGFGSNGVLFTPGTISTGLTATVSPNGAGGDRYFVDVTGMTGTGTVGIALPLGAAQTSSGGQSLPASTPTSELVTFDNVAPIPSISPTSIGLTRNTDTFVTVTFSEPIQGFTQAGLQATNASVLSFTALAPDTYVFTVHALADGPFSVTIIPGTATDFAANPNTTATVSGTLDTTPPVVTVTRVSPAVISVEPAVFEVSFSEPIIAGSFVASDVLFTGSTTAGILVAQVTPVVGSPTNFTVSVTGMTSVGTIRVSVGANAVADIAGNLNVTPAVADEDVQLIGIPPTVTLSTTASFPSNDASVPVTAVFSARVTGFTASDLVVVNGTIGSFLANADGKTYTFDLFRVADGPVTVTVPPGAAFSILSVPNDPGSLSGTFDTTPPLPSITVTTPFPTQLPTVPVTVSFSEPVTGFDQTDITVSGPATVSNFQASPGGQTFTFDLTRTADGSFTLTVAGGAASDAAGNVNLTGGATGSFDTTGPIPQLLTPITFPTNADGVPVTVAFPERVTGFDQSDLVVTNGSVTAFQASADGQTFTFTLARGADGPFTIAIAATAATDLAGNPSGPAGLSGTFDVSGPTTSMTTTATFPTNQPGIPVTVRFGEVVTGFDPSDLVVVNGAVTNFQAVGDGQTFLFTLARLGDGTFDITLPAGAATDAAGNFVSAARLSGSFDTAGAVTTATPQAAAFFGTTAVFIVSFDQDPANPAAFTASSVELGGTASPTTVTIRAGLNPRTFILDVTGMTQPGTVTARVLAGAVTDPAGNPSAASDAAQVLFNPLPVVPPVPPPDAGLSGTRQFAVGAGEGGSPQIILAGPDGRTLFQRLAFDTSFTGGVRTAAADLNGDGIAEAFAGTGPGGVSRVRVLDGVSGNEVFAVQPFEAAFAGGVYVAAGDLTGDGTADLVITADEGGGPRVLIYDGKTFGLVGNFFGISDPDFRGGARAAVGDFNADGRADLVVAAGFGGGPRVAVYDGRTVVGGPTPTRLFNDIFVFEQTLRNGVFVAAGDIDGDAFADLVVGGGPGGGPRVTVLSGRGLVGGLLASPPEVANFFAGNEDNRGGVRVAVKDLDGDNKADLVVGDGEGAGSRVTAYLGSVLSAGGATQEFALDTFPGFTGGVYVG